MLKWFVLFLFSYSVCFSQQNCHFTLRGKVLDEHNQEPLAFAFIAIEGTSFATISDSLGNYTLKGLCRGKKIVHCDHMGCERMIDTLMMEGDLIHNFYPEHHVNELNLVVVGNPNQSKTSANNTISLNQVELEDVKGNSLGEALSSLNGIQSNNSGSNVSKPTIHGMTGNRVLILDNGLRLEGQQWGTDHAPELDFNNSSSIQVVMGANSVRYGSDAIGGVILVDDQPLRKAHGFDGEVLMSGASNGRVGVTSARIDGNLAAIPQLSFRLFGTMKEGGTMSAPNYYLANTGMNERNYGWSLGYFHNNFDVQVRYSDFNSVVGIFAGAHIANLTDLTAAFEAKEPLIQSGFSYDIGLPRQEISHEIFQVKSTVKTGKSSRLNLLYGRQFNHRQEFDAHRSVNGRPSFDFYLTTQNGSANWEIDRKRHSLEIGSTIKYQLNTWDGSYFIPNYESIQQGNYFIWKIDLAESKKLELGARLDWANFEVYRNVDNEVVKNDHQYINGNYTIGYYQTLGNHLVWKSNIGTAWRPPNMSELYSAGLHHGSAALEYGNQNLEQEQLYNLNSGVRWIKNKWKLDVNGYLNYFSNYIFLNPIGETELTIRGAFPVFEYISSKVWLNGVDISLDYQPKSYLKISMQTAQVRAFNITSNNFLFGMPSDQYECKVSFSPKIKKLNLAEITLHGNYLTEQIRVPANADFIDPPAAAFIVNASMKMNFVYKSVGFNTTLGVQNVLNTSYRSYLNRFRYFSDELGRNVYLKLIIPFEIKEEHHHHI